MSNLMKNNAQLILTLAKLKPANRRAVLQAAPKELIHALSEGALNIIKGKVPLSKRQYGHLRRNQSKIRLLANPKVSVRRKQKLLTVADQRGGFLGTLAAILIPTVASLIGSAVH